MRFRLILSVTGWGSVGGCSRSANGIYRHYCDIGDIGDIPSVREPIGMNLILVVFRKWPRGESLDSLVRSTIIPRNAVPSSRAGIDRRKRSAGMGLVLLDIWS